MDIAGIDTQSQNIKPFYPVVSISTLGNTDSSSAGTESDSLEKNSLPGVSTQVTLSTDGKRQSGIAQSGDSQTDVERRQAAREAQQAKEEREQRETASAERSLQMINGIPLYGGTLVSMINYPDGSWEAFDVFSGKPVTAEERIRIGRETDGDNTDAFSFYSKGIYNGLSAAEIYEKIQQMMGIESADLDWRAIGANDI
ncbi:hypothetical protein [Brenneria corticis]|uniref:Uncharacterized protein n=1 Tax=Brenneria corticis TaxID=2173106 RepID=A0A2U1UDG8_9GAMM|nr:hypothetical protein [Brenneria sp. CFCC 11842]PWC19657.1 hypothetical protein DDT56_01400 [Brenneria sp. CFCC 11842]